MFLPAVIDVEFIAGPLFDNTCPFIAGTTPSADAWLVWIEGDWLEPYYGAYWIAATEQHDERGTY